MRKVLSFIGLMLAVIVMSGSIAFATPSESIKLTPEQVKEFKVNATKDGIDEKTQEKLLNKLQDGELLDCMIPAKIEKAQKYLVVSLEQPRAEYTFEDGSKIISEISIESNDIIEPMAVITTDVKCYMGSALYYAQFYANVTFTDYGDDRINSIRDQKAYSITSPITYGTFGITNKVASPSAPATARFNWKILTNGTWYNQYLQLNVQNGSTWNTYQM